MIGLQGIYDPSIVCRFMGAGGTRCLVVIKFAKCYLCLCIYMNMYVFTQVNIQMQFPTLRTLLSIEENQITSIKAHKMTSFWNKCEHTYIQMFKYPR